MTDLEQCKATLREDAARLCAKSKHPNHPFGDGPCTVLAVIEGLETELAEARIAQAALAVDISDWVRQNAFGDYLLDYVHPDGAVEAQWLCADDIAPMLWAIAEAEATNEG